MPTNLILIKKGEFMKKDLLKTNVYDVEDTLIIVGSCLDRMQPEAYKELERISDNIYDVCLEETHINMVITKLIGMISRVKINKIIFASVDKSPHCVRANEIVYNKELIQMNENKTNINWYPGHMAKTKRLISENINLIDVVYEVVDARMPKSSKIIDIDNYIGNKKRILIMNKYDLCDKVETDKWIKYYESIGYVVVKNDLTIDKKLNYLVGKTKELMALEFTKMEEKNMKSTRKIRVLVVGVPNVGKSTLINRLVGRKIVNTGNKPGVTKNLDWIRVDKDIELLDSPGILWPKFDDDTAYNLASLTAIKEEVLPINQVINYILNTLYKLYPKKLEERYGITNYNDDLFVETLDIIGKKRGCLIKGGEIDYDKVFNVILNDIKNGYIKEITFDRYE